MDPSAAGYSSRNHRSRSQRGLAAAGAVLAAASVALAAYAAHVAEPGAQVRLQSAAWFAFGHGIALAALAPHAVRRFGRFALAGLLLGTLVFSGSLVGAYLFGAPTTLAPFGGGLMILSWLLWAADLVRS
ncbi:MAG TPA: DUF423 domain-containing protein [Lysobacter sp.]|nr:DUF423 domain-containing protein [Lysobacter sp.]